MLFKGVDVMGEVAVGLGVGFVRDALPSQLTPEETDTLRLCQEHVSRPLLQCRRSAPLFIQLDPVMMVGC